MRWTTDKIRQSFLDFFEERGHQIVPSASLIPKGDPTLLFTNAGMVPFKDYFLGVRTPAARARRRLPEMPAHFRQAQRPRSGRPRHATITRSSRCSATGRSATTTRREAIAWHWELITEVWGIPADRLWATVYKDDDEAEQAWLELGVPAARTRSCASARRTISGRWARPGRAARARRSISIAASRPATRRPHHAEPKCAVNVDGCARFIELGEPRLHPVQPRRGGQADAAADEARRYRHGPGARRGGVAEPRDRPARSATTTSICSRRSSSD